MTPVSLVTRVSRISYAAGTPAAAAAPAGGAWKQGRGCTLIFGVCVLATGLFAQDTVNVDVPSGADVRFHDVIADEQGTVPAMRYRFVAPQIAGELGFVDVSDDIEWLCANYALPQQMEQGKTPERIVISLMSEPTDFGVANPDVTQFFESFDTKTGNCIWEVF